MLIFRIALGLAAVSTVGACGGSLPATTNPAPDTSPNADMGMVPEPSAHPPKSLRVRFALSKTKMSGAQVGVEYGVSRSYIADPDEFRLTLVGVKDTTLSVIKTYDPHRLRVYPNTNPPDERDTAVHSRPEREAETRARAERERRPLGERIAIERVRRREPAFAESHFLVDSVMVEVIVPFDYRARAIRLTDVYGASYGTIPLTKEISTFCQSREADDAGCKAWMVGYRRFGP